MKKIYTQNGFTVYEFTPSLFKLFYNDMEHITFQRKIRFVIEYFRGYKVYYLEKDGVFVAYSVVSKGGGRYVFASEEDIVVGPYFVDIRYRGKGYSKILVEVLLHLCKYKYAYDWINKDNIPSLRCSKSNGFKIINTANIIKPFRKIVVCNDDSGEYYILKYIRNGRENA